MSQFRFASILAACLSIFSLTPAHAGVINGDFETSDFSGWSVATSGGASAAVQFGSTFLVPSPSNIAELAASIRGIQNQSASLSQSFQISSGEVLRFDLDTVSLAILGGSASVFVDVTGPGFAFQATQDGLYSLPITLGGVYLLEARIVASGSRAGGPFNPSSQAIAVLRMDNVRIVPEPASILLWLLGGGLLCVASRRKAAANQ